MTAIGKLGLLCYYSPKRPQMYAGVSFMPVEQICGFTFLLVVLYYFATSILNVINVHSV